MKQLDEVWIRIKQDYIYIVCILVLLLLLALTILSAATYENKCNTYWSEAYDECGCVLCPTKPMGFNESYDLWDPELLVGLGGNQNENQN